MTKFLLLFYCEFIFKIVLFFSRNTEINDLTKLEYSMNNEKNVTNFDQGHF